MLISRTLFDNLSRPTEQLRYHTAVDEGNRIARSKSYHDERGRVWKSETYAVNPATGAVGDALAARTWYDAAGNVIKSQPAGSKAFTKTAYDGAGRPVARYVGYDLAESSWAEAHNVTGDTIFEQTEYVYDAAGNTLFVTSRQRLHDATGTGALSGPAGDQPRSRDSYTASWYDGIRRQVATARYGTHEGTVPTRPDSPPPRSDDMLVRSTEYNARGEAHKTIDPAGREDRVLHDDAGRVIRTIENYVDGDPSTGASDEDVTVATTYTTAGQLATLTAMNPTTGDQVTQYVYGATLADSGVARNDLLRAVIYPDSDDTAAGLPPTLALFGKLLADPGVESCVRCEKAVMSTSPLTKCIAMFRRVCPIVAHEPPTGTDKAKDVLIALAIRGAVDNPSRLWIVNTVCRQSLDNPEGIELSRRAILHGTQLPQGSFDIASDTWEAVIVQEQCEFQGTAPRALLVELREPYAFWDVAEVLRIHELTRDCQMQPITEARVIDVGQSIRERSPSKTTQEEAR